MSQQQPQQPQQINIGAKEDSFLSGFKGAIGVIFALFIVFVAMPCGACVMCGGGTMCLGATADYQERSAEVRQEMEDDRQAVETSEDEEELSEE